MKLIREIMEKENPTVAEALIKSNSKDINYLIRLRKNGEITHEPPCVASSYKNECSHILEAKELWKEKWGWMWQF